MPRSLKSALKVCAVLALLYLFFVSIQLMGDCFKTWKGFSEALIESASNPFVGLFIGILSTSIIQSSSTTTSMTVGFVASGVLPVYLAVPIVMGANIGTSVTAALVSMGHVHRRAEFRRATACATVHDIFNLLSVAILLPVELISRSFLGVGILEAMADGMARGFAGAGGLKFTSPLKAVTKPASVWIRESFLGSIFDSADTIAVVGLCIALGLLILSLIFIVKTLRSMVLKRVELFFDKYVGAHAIFAMGMGMVITAAVQSSSITTSMLVPMAGAGILTLRQAFPITLGANIGTTITAILASMAAAGTPEAQIAALTIACVHLLFNICGILIWYPLVAMREVPLRLAQRLADACAKRRWVAFVFVALVFFVIPGILVGVWKMLS
jgi:solute carrier family 34 (sodium-dependent phosphate cotransporter)